MMRRLTPSRLTGLLVATALLLSGCGLLSDDGHPLTTLDPKGVQSNDIHNLVKPVFIIAGVVFLLVEGAILWVIFRYRHRNDSDELEPKQTHGNFSLEIMWTIAPAVLLAVIAVLNVKAIWALEERDANAITVDVYGQQWWWEYRYDVDGDGSPDVITADQAVLPVNRQTDLNIRSNDVIHSFWIPALNGKKDAVPGRTNHWKITPEETGTFQGTCTEFCGLSHAFMRTEVTVVSEAEFEAWLDEQQKPAAEPDDGSLAADGKEVFFQQCASCHQINGYDSAGEATDGAPDPAYNRENHPLLSENAPNLTHLMSRDYFAGGVLDVTENNLRKWVLDPSAVKEMAPDQQRGMPTLPLTSEQLEAVVAYLMTLN